jgi:hypothetical protein
MDNLKREAQKKAAQKVAGLLTTLEQLDTVIMHRTTIMNKKLAIEAQLKAAVQTQLEEAKDGYSLLNESTELISNVRGK